MERRAPARRDPAPGVRRAGYGFRVAATVRSRDGAAGGWASGSVSLPLENSARDLTVAATLNGDRAGTRRSDLVVGTRCGASWPTGRSALPGSRRGVAASSMGPGWNGRQEDGVLEVSSR